MDELTLELTAALEKHAREGDAIQRGYAAAHPLTLAATLVYLSDDPSDYVVGRVARNPNTPVHVLEKLAERTRGGKTGLFEIDIIWNRSTPAYLVERLTQSRFPEVREAARLKLSTVQRDEDAQRRTV